MHMRSYRWVVLVLALAGYSCGDAPASTGEDATAETDTSAAATAESEDVPLESVSLETVLVNDPEMDGYPLHEISLVLAGRRHVLDTIQVCEPLTAEERGEHNMPADALAACGGWWAGAGDYFYAIRRNDSLVVYQGWLDEMQQDESYHYEVVWAKAI